MIGDGIGTVAIMFTIGLFALVVLALIVTTKGVNDG